MPPIENDSILYVDDEQANLDGFKYTFWKQFDVHTALNSADGLDILSKREIKVVITDQRMPSKTGVEFLEEIRAIYPDITRVLVTGFSDMEAIVQAINKGNIFKYVAKPWQKQEMYIILHDSVEAYNLRTQNRILIQSLLDSNHQLEVAKEKAEQSDYLKTMFLNNVSHEIRTPLNAIVGFIQLLGSFNFTMEKVKEFSNIILRNTHDLVHVIQNIVDIATIMSGQMELSIGRKNVAEMFDEVVGEIYNYPIFLEKSSIKFGIIQSDTTDDVFILCDSNRLKQVLIELLINAMKFTNNGSVEFSYAYADTVSADEFVVVDFSAQSTGFVKFSVSDSGIGIAADKYEYIFEQFIKIVDSEQQLFRGMGLGLTIVKCLIELMNGAISVKSEIDKGSVFSVYLPVDKSIH